MDIDSKFNVNLSDNFNNGGQRSVDEARAFFESIRAEVEEGVRSRMREFSGAEKSSVQSEISGSDEVSLRVWSDTPQAYVDEFGQEPGSPGGAKQHFPPFGTSSDLFKWVVAIINPQPKPAQAAKRAGRLSVKETLKRANKPPRFAFGASQLSLQKSVTFLVARAIHERGLPRFGDPLRAPFASTRAAMLPQIRQGLEAVGASVADWVNE